MPQGAKELDGSIVAFSVVNELSIEPSGSLIVRYNDAPYQILEASEKTLDVRNK